VDNHLLGEAIFIRLWSTAVFAVFKQDRERFFQSGKVPATKMSRTKINGGRLTMNAVKLTSIVAISLAAAAITARAQTVFSGTGLSSLAYSANISGDAQYVPASGPTPALAQLYTADSSTSGDSPAVFAAGPWGTVNAFSASYDLYSGNGGTPYFLLYLTDDPTYSSPIVAFGGSTLNSSTLVHVGDLTHGGITLSALDTTIDPISGLPFGGETIAWVGIEIGDGGSGATTANIDSIAIVPEPATVVLVGTSLMGMLLVVRRRKA
jgi:hypothetical protein